MKKQSIKKLALLGLAGGLIAATSSVQAAERANPSNAQNRSSNTSAQPIAGCGRGSCGGSVADNYGSCGASAQPSHSSCGASAQPSNGSCGASSQPSHGSCGASAHPGEAHETVQQGCAPHQYTVNSRDEQYSEARHGKPQFAQPQSNFRYVSDSPVPPDQMPSQPANNASFYKTNPSAPTAQPTQTTQYSSPNASRQKPNNTSRFVSSSEMSVPPNTSVPPSSSVYSTPTSASRPQGSPAPFNQAATPTQTPSNTMSPSPYSPQATDRMHRDATQTQAPKTDAPKKTFW